MSIADLNLKFPADPEQVEKAKAAILYYMKNSPATLNQVLASAFSEDVVTAAVIALQNNNQVVNVGADGKIQPLKDDGSGILVPDLTAAQVVP